MEMVDRSEFHRFTSPQCAQSKFLKVRAIAVC